MGLNLSVVGANSFLPLYTTHVLSLSSFIVFLLEPDFVVKPISLKLKNMSSKYCCLSSNSIGLLSKACLSISNPFGLSSNKTPNISSAASLLATLSLGSTLNKFVYIFAILSCLLVLSFCNMSNIDFKALSSTELLVAVYFFQVLLHYLMIFLEVL